MLEYSIKKNCHASLHYHKKKKIVSKQNYAICLQKLYHIFNNIEICQGQDVLGFWPLLYTVTYNK